jgi:hypothetical protein
MRADTRQPWWKNGRASTGSLLLGLSLGCLLLCWLHSLGAFACGWIPKRLSADRAWYSLMDEANRVRFWSGMVLAVVLLRFSRLPDAPRLRIGDRLVCLGLVCAFAFGLQRIWMVVVGASAGGLEFAAAAFPTALLVVSLFTRSRITLGATLAATYAAFSLAVFHIYPVLHIAGCLDRHAVARLVFRSATVVILSFAGALFIRARATRPSASQAPLQPL